MLFIPILFSSQLGGYGGPQESRQKQKLPQQDKNLNIPEYSKIN